MKMNTDLHAHYRQLLGLSEGCKVIEVNLDVRRQLDLPTGDNYNCPPWRVGEVMAEWF